jgi:hypothetical protein
MGRGVPAGVGVARAERSILTNLSTSDSPRLSALKVGSRKPNVEATIANVTAKRTTRFHGLFDIWTYS